MQIMSDIEMFQELCKVKNKWGLLFSVSYDANLMDVIAEAKKAAPWLDKLEFGQMFSAVFNGGYLFFDAEKEMRDVFDMTVGGDGPTTLNSYEGPTRVYALTCGPDGKLITGNT